MTKVVVDDVVPAGETRLLVAIAAGALLAVAGQGVLAYVRAVILVHLRARLDIQLMTGFVRHLLALPVSFFQQRTSGDLLMRLGSNAVLREVLATQAVSSSLDGAFVLVYLGVLLIHVPELGIALLLLVLAQLGVILVTRPQVAELVQRDLQARTLEQSYVVEVTKGILMLKGSASEQSAYECWNNLFSAQLNIALQRSTFAARVDSTILLLRSSCPVILLSIGASMVLASRIEIGTVLAYNAIAAATLVPISTLIASAQQLQLAAAHIERVADVLQTEPEEQNDSGLPVRLKGAIDVKDVSFRYTANSPSVLDGITCSIAAGQKIALVGSTGSGKSSLAMLLLGLYPTDAGQILFDGVDYRDLNRSRVRRNIGLVLQDATVFQGSIRMNICFHNPQMSEVEMIWAAKMACLHDDIAAMPMGYETVVSEGGTNLSGGQRQRLAIARALAARPAILLLDEATSNLDEQTEREIHRNLRLLKSTRIVISHRLSTIADADQILVLHKGRLVEQGSHQELAALRGYYSGLYAGDGLNWHPPKSSQIGALRSRV